MSITEIVILTLLGIDIANVLMIAYVFHWAKNAIHKFREITVELLSTENPESEGIIRHISESVTVAVRNQIKGQLVTLVRQLYAKGVDAITESAPEDSTPDARSPGIAPGINPKLAAKAGEILGIDPSYMPLLMQAYQTLKGKQHGEQNNYNSDDSW